MTRSQSKAQKFRWILFVLALLCWAAGVCALFPTPWFNSIGTLGTPATFFSDSSESSDENGRLILNGLIYIGIFLLLQWFFLRPRGKFSFQFDDLARPLISRKIAAGFIAMLLSFAWIATLLEMSNHWEQIMDSSWGLAICWIVMGIFWLIWTLVFLVYWRQGDDYSKMGKFVRALVVGSLLDVFVSGWVFIKNPHQEECYCARGSYTGLIFGSTVLLWAFGPGLVLLFLREKKRREKFTHSSMPL